ncbi:M28 family peptidase [bacterium SCSIO 12741]|nr:M28 family peptidase [bacterium SCSIO 12741]
MKLQAATLAIFLLIIWGCEEDKPKRQLGTGAAPKSTFKPVAKPAFNADSAYHYIDQQVAFGPRVPGTKEHKACADYLSAEMTRFGWDVEVQDITVEVFNGQKLPAYNIMASYDKANPNRVVLFAHWDTRPFADRDDSRENVPIPGANDGASGVGVLMEMARVIAQDSLKPNVGIDIVFFDAEDYGKPSQAMGGQDGNTWCLGSQYWSQNLPEGYQPKYGVLLDMVGATGAVFPKEGVSMQYNPELVDRVWYLAGKLGYGNYFVPKIAPGGITDDHLYVNRLAGIPTIDIIHYHHDRRDFGHFHHRHTDDMAIIDTKTLHAVGVTVLELIYRED